LATTGGMKTPSAVILSLFLALPWSDASADWRINAETGALYESNLSNSERAADEEPDAAWKSNASIGDGFQLSRNLRVNLAADLRAVVWDRLDGLDEFGGGGSVDLRYRFGLGREAPWIALTERLGYDAFGESARSRSDETVAVRGGFALSPRVAVEAGYTFRDSAARDDFFDLQSHSGNVRLVVDLTSSLQIALGYTYRDGDVISYAVPPRPDILQFADESRSVSTFGDQPRYTAYRLNGQTHAVSISAGHAVTQKLSVQVSYEYATTAHDPLRYENHSVEAKIAFVY